MKKGLALLFLTAMMMGSAGEVHALKAYTPEVAHACSTCKSCVKSASVAAPRVGAFDLAGVAPDKASGSRCGLGSKFCNHGSLWFPLFSENCPIAGAAGLVVKPAAAIVNDAVYLLTMPYRKSEPLPLG